MPHIQSWHQACPRDPAADPIADPTAGQTRLHSKSVSSFVMLLSKTQVYILFDPEEKMPLMELPSTQTARQV